MKSRVTRQIKVIDSHTGGEPTRLVVEGAPDLGTGPMVERLHRLRAEYDTFRSGVVNEPRGSDVMVGAVLCRAHWTHPVLPESSSLTMLAILGCVVTERSDW